MDVSVQANSALACHVFPGFQRGDWLDQHSPWTPSIPGNEQNKKKSAADATAIIHLTRSLFTATAGWQWRQQEVALASQIWFLLTSPRSRHALTIEIVWWTLHSWRTVSTSLLARCRSNYFSRIVDKSVYRNLYEYECLKIYPSIILSIKLRLNYRRPKHLWAYFLCSAMLEHNDRSIRKDDKK